MLVRGDTDFTQTKHLDRWDADPRVQFIFGVDATANLHVLADDLPAAAWQPLRAAAALRGEDAAAAAAGERQGTDRGRRAQFENIRLRRGRRWRSSSTGRRPAARATGWSWSARTCRWRRASSVLFDDYRYFFYLTNDRTSPAAEIVFLANDRCNQENLHAQLKHGVRALQAPVDNLVSNWAYMVMTALAWNLKAWLALQLPEQPRTLGRAASRGEADGPDDGVQDVCECLRAAAVSDHPHEPDGWSIGCCPGTRGSRSSSACSTCCDVDAPQHEVGVRMLRSAAATRTEKAEGGDHDRNQSDARQRLRRESEESVRLRRALSWMRNSLKPSLV